MLFCRCKICVDVKHHLVLILAVGIAAELVFFLLKNNNNIVTVDQIKADYRSTYVTITNFKLGCPWADQSPLVAYSIVLLIDDCQIFRKLPKNDELEFPHRILGETRVYMFGILKNCICCIIHKTDPLILFTRGIVQLIRN